MVMPRPDHMRIPSTIEPAHRLYAYCARFPSENAETAISEYTRKGDSIYDPFCGSGTSLTAGLVLGRRVVGSDIDVLAVMLSSVKCTPASPEGYASWRSRFTKRIERAFTAVGTRWSRDCRPKPGGVLSVGDLDLSIASFPKLNYWFPPQLVALLAAIAAEAHRSTDDHMEQVALVSLSAAIIAKWPNTLSYAMDVDHTRPHRVIQRFNVWSVFETITVVSTARSTACPFCGSCTPTPASCDAVETVLCLGRRRIATVDDYRRASNTQS